jgi:hypothetical protein
MDIVNVKANTAFITGNGILPAHPPDIGRQRIVGATSDFNGCVGRGLAEIDEIEGAKLFQFLSA